ncbi:MAG: hypothetical protein ACK4LQ_12350 [Pararhodobacter sp.]
MALVLHLGAHATDEGAIARWLEQNAPALNERGVLAPPPRVFLRAISQALAARPEGPATRDQEAALLRDLGMTARHRHLAVSAPGLLGPPESVISASGFYVKDVARRIYGLRLLFPASRLHFLLALRRPAGFLPALLARPGVAPAEALLPHLVDDELPWSSLVLTLRRHAPAAGLSVWRHEDLPRVWPQVLATLAPDAADGRAAAEADAGALRAPLLAGVGALAAAHLSAEARLRAERYLGANPPGDLAQVRRVYDAFAARFGESPNHGAPADAAAPDLPAWARAQIARLDARYDTEWDDIANTPGVEVLS